MTKSAAVLRLPRISSLSWDDCRLLVESVQDYAIFMLDPNGCVATWNIGAEKIKGYAPDEIIGQHFSRFYPPEDVAAGKPEHELAIARSAGRVEDEGWRVRKDGSRFWANVVITALRVENGALRGFGKVTRDLTQRRRAEEQLRAAEERFHLLVDAVTDYAIFMLDETGHITSWNSGARRTKGYEASEIIGKHFSTFYTPEDRAAGRPEHILETVRREGRFEDEGWRVRKDGSRFWANVVITALRDQHGKLSGFAKVTRDLTARRQIEQTERTLLREQAARAAAEESERRIRQSQDMAQKAAREAEEANRVKDEFLATVSHELRTPLNAILGWASLLRDRPLDPSISKGVETIHRNAQAQARIIEDILDTSRIITGKLLLDLKLASLVDVVNEAIAAVRPSAAGKGISIDFSPPATPATVVCDTGRLRQVVWNLLSNAVKFTDTGGKVAVRIEREGTKLTVTVRDTGRGIDAELLPHVFERFRQADSSITRRLGGLGLGLAIVRHIVELHGGYVHAESAGKGQGALFKVAIPIRALVAEDAAETEPAARPAQSAVEERGLLSGVRVLVVDDEEDARDLLQDALTGAGAEVETAGSAAAGFAAVQRFRPQVLVSDIGMPEEDGYSLIRRVRALPPAEGGGIPSVALTAYTRDVDRTRALAAGFTTHIGKPVSPGDLVAAVGNLAALTRR